MRSSDTVVVGGKTQNIHSRHVLCQIIAPISAIDAVDEPQTAPKSLTVRGIPRISLFFYIQ